MSESGLPDEHDPRGDDLAQGDGRLTHRVRAVIVAAHSAMLLASLPVVLFMLAFSLFEGGDLALKGRLQGWALFAVGGNLVCAVVLGSTSVRYYRGLPVRRGFVMTTSALLGALAAGWAWVYQGQLFTDASMLCVWVVLTTPALIAMWAHQWRRAGRKQQTAS